MEVLAYVSCCWWFLSNTEAKIPWNCKLRDCFLFDLQYFCQFTHVRGITSQNKNEWKQNAKSYLWTEVRNIHSYAENTWKAKQNIIGIRLKTNAFSNFSWAGLSFLQISLISPLLLGFFLLSSNLPNNEKTNTSP